MVFVIGVIMCFGLFLLIASRKKPTQNNNPPKPSDSAPGASKATPGDSRPAPGASKSAPGASKPAPGASRPVPASSGSGTGKGEAVIRALSDGAAVQNILSGITKAPAPPAADELAALVRPGNVRRFNYETLPDSEKQLYSIILRNILEMKTTFSLGYSEPERAAELVRYIRDDHPEIFWMNGGASYVVRDMKTTLTVSTFFDISLVPEKKRRLEQKITEILNAARACPRIYDQMIWIHDYIANHCEYHYEAYRYGDGHDDCLTKYPHAFGAYGCLVEGKAVCAGYTRGFQILMHRLGISCGFIGGVMKSGGVHAWNYVQLGDEFYYIDLTHDDPTSEAVRDRHQDRMTHCYCMITTEEMLRSRRYADDVIFVPDCRGTRYNYYVQNGLYLERYSPEALQKMMRKKRNGDIFEFRCANRSVFETAKNALLNSGDGYELVGGAKASLMTEEAFNVIVIRFQ